MIQARKIDSTTFDGNTDANGWKVQLLPSGKRIWTKKGSISVSVSGNGFGGGSLSNYPVGVTYNDVLAVVSIVSPDNALSLSAGIRQQDVKYSVSNAYGSAVTNSAFWSAALIEI